MFARLVLLVGYVLHVLSNLALVLVFVSLAAGAETVGGTVLMLLCAVVCAGYLRRVVFGAFHDDIAP